MADDNQKTDEAVEEAKDAADEAKDAAAEAADASDSAEKSAQKAEEAAQEVKEEVKEVKEEAAQEKKASKAVSQNLEKIIKSIEELSVLELADLVKALEEKFGVSAAAPVAIAAGGAAGAGGEDASSEQTTFNVILADGGANKISVIKAVRELVPTLGLAEAKALVDSAPKQVLEGVNKETAKEAKTKLETAGAKVELK